MISVAEVMTPRDRLVVLGPDATLWEARGLMASNGIRHLPVVDGEHLVGLVSQTDLLVAQNSDSIRVREIMIRDVETIDVRTQIRHAALRMQRRKLSCLPVMQGDRLVGIVTDSDFLGIAIALIEQMEEVEPEAQF